MAFQTTSGFTKSCFLTIPAGLLDQILLPRGSWSFLPLGPLLWNSSTFTYNVLIIFLRIVGLPQLCPFPCIYLCSLQSAM